MEMGQRRRATMARAREEYPRDLVGYGAKLPDPQWPSGARLALQIALNYEAGGELSVLHGDATSEGMLTDSGFPAVRGMRSMLVESSFEYGSRRGVWRLLRMFEERKIKVSVFAVAMGFGRTPEVARAMVEAGHEIVSHGWRWIDYQHVPAAVERKHIRLAVETITKVTGRRPLGWMTGRPGPNTRRLLMEEGGFLYDRDALNDELPYWVEVEGKPHLVIPYSYETNDNRFDGNVGFSTAADFFTYMKDAFDVLYAESATEPKMMSLGLHDRLIGRPARARGLADFLDYVLARPDVWICRGIDIAEHWRRHHPPPTTRKAMRKSTR
jgi:putative urate catabolism protein